MILRAAFWIGLVALLAPHEPDLGLGRPGAGTANTSPPTLRSLADGLSLRGTDCGPSCAGSLLHVFRLNTDSGVTQRLADVKAQIEADQRARAAKAKAI